MTKSPLLTTKELARALSVSEKTVYRWLEADPPPPHYRPAGGDLRWDEAEVREWARADVPPAA